MATELLTEFDEAWIDGLAPVQLVYHHEELIRRRSARQRETLHIQVAAAAVIADGGKAAKQMDSALGVASARPTIGPSSPVSDEPAAPAVQAHVAQVNAETAHLTREHRRGRKEQ